MSLLDTTIYPISQKNSTLVNYESKQLLLLKQLKTFIHRLSTTYHAEYTQPLSREIDMLATLIRNEYLKSRNQQWFLRLKKIYSILTKKAFRFDFSKRIEFLSSRISIADESSYETHTSCCTSDLVERIMTDLLYSCELLQRLFHQIIATTKLVQRDLFGAVDNPITLAKGLFAYGLLASLYVQLKQHLKLFGILYPKLYALNNISPRYDEKRSYDEVIEWNNYKKPKGKKFPSQLSEYLDIDGILKEDKLKTFMKANEFLEKYQQMKSTDKKNVEKHSKKRKRKESISNKKKKIRLKE